jgi:hypothetical protein
VIAGRAHVSRDVEAGVELVVHRGEELQARGRVGSRRGEPIFQPFDRGAVAV